MENELNVAQEEQVNDIAENVVSVQDEVLLAEDVASRINYEFSRAYLVKQLPAEMVTKKIKVPVDTEEKDEEGNTIQEMQEKEIEMESVLRTGIVLKVPFSANIGKEGVATYAVGDRVVYRNMRATDFDMIQDSALIEPFDIICKATRK